MWYRTALTRTFLKISISAAVIMTLGILSFLPVINTNRVQAQGNAQATAEPFQNALTLIAAPTATEGPTLSVTATNEVPATEVTASSSALSASDAMATITNQQAQIKALQDQLASKQGDNGATLYAVVIIALGIILAFAVFFGLKRG
jgi:hypothetical protein